jgi:imidazolonepropionase-like amidohydrolase
MRVLKWSSALWPLSLLAGCGGASTTSVPDEQEVAAMCSPSSIVADDTLMESPRTLIRGGTVMTATGETFAPGYVLFEDGRIVEVGAGDGPEDGAVVVDATGRWVTPGLIDSHSHLGVYPAPGYAAHSDGNEASAPLTPQVQAVHSVWPQDPGFERAIAGGVTSMLVLPGSANIIGGQGFTLKLHRGVLAAEDMRFPGAPTTLKMACGENPKRVYGDTGAPQTRMGEVSILRQAYFAAQEYLAQRTEWNEERETWCENPGADDAPDPRSVNLAMETLADVLAGDTLVQIHCYRADEMLVQMQIAEEFGYRIRSFHHAVEAYKIRDALAESEISVSTWADWWGFKLEAFDSIVESAALLQEAGARPVIHSDSAIGIQRLNQEAAKAMFAGQQAGIDIDEEDALRWITVNPAWTLGVENQAGALIPGYMADVVVWSGNPFSIYTSADLVWVDGLLEYDRSAPRVPWSDFETGLWPTTGEVQP